MAKVGLYVLLPTYVVQGFVVTRAHPAAIEIATDNLHKFTTSGQNPFLLPEPFELRLLGWFALRVPLGPMARGG